MTESTAILVAVAVMLAIAAAAVAVLSRARQAGLALHRQIDAAKDEIGRQRADHNLWAERLQQDMQAASAAESSRSKEGIHTFKEGMRTAREDVAHVQESVRALADHIDAFTTSMLEAFDLLARKPVQPLYLDPALTATRSDEELATLAQSIAILRPLTPYPKWRTDVELQNPDLSYQLRRWFWQYFHDLRRDAPIVVRWHGDTQLRLFLGNDVSGQIYIAGCWEPNEFAFLDRILQPGMTFLDAGANDGVYTVFAARRVGSEGTVWAFEPSRRELERLRFNLELNRLPARVFPVALAEVNGEAELTVGGYEHEGHNTLGAFAYAGVEIERKETIELRRLDDIVLEDPPARIDVIKLDVEGAEYRLLQGALATLRRYRPIVMFEVSETSLRNQGTTGKAVLELFRNHDFALHTYDLRTGLVVPLAHGMFADNMVAVPHEKALPPAVHLPWPGPSA